MKPSRRICSSTPTFSASGPACDFAVFGHLTQLAELDPTPMALTLKTAPRVTAWVGLMEDQSGLEPSDSDWFDSAQLPETLAVLLAEAGRTYAPVMLANARAVATGAAEVACEVDGGPWSQQPFPYQAKRLLWLRQSYAALPEHARAVIYSLLSDAGLLALFVIP